MQQITKAMKMVSAAKLRRAQEHALESRPYASMMDRMLKNIAAAAAATQELSEAPLLQVREEKRIQMIVVSSDTGLAGGFNSNLLRLAHRFADEHRGADLRVEAIGRKGRDYFRKRRFTLSGDHIGVVDKPSYEKAKEVADKMIEQYRRGDIDAVYLFVNEFKSIMAPNLISRKILPVEMPKGEEHQIDYIFEQPPDEIVRALLPRYVELQIYRAMLESISAYHAARMTAMDSATNNAGDVIQSLTLTLNRVRQAAITREIIEIVSGANALA